MRDISGVIAGLRERLCDFHPDDAADVRALLDAYAEARYRELGFVSMASRIHNRLSRWRWLVKARRQQLRAKEVWYYRNLQPPTAELEAAKAERDFFRHEYNEAERKRGDTLVLLSNATAERDTALELLREATCECPYDDCSRCSRRKAFLDGGSEG